MVSQPQKTTWDSFGNLFAEKPRHFLLARSWARKLRLDVIAQKSLMQENCGKNLIVWFRPKWLWLKTYDKRFCTMGKLNDLHLTWNTAGRKGKEYSSVLADNCWCTNQLVALRAGVLNLIAFIERPRCWRTFSVSNNGSVWTDDNYANKFFSKYFKLEGSDYFTKNFQDKRIKQKWKIPIPAIFV